MDKSPALYESRLLHCATNSPYGILCTDFNWRTGWGMLHQWFNVTGLGFDFVGVMILAYEWWIALNAERRESEIAEQEMRFRPNPMAPQPQNPHQAVIDHMREDLRFRQRMNRVSVAHSMRRGWFVTAFLFIASGFALQVIGSWPGGLPGLGN